MRTQELKISAIPAVLYGKPAPNIWLFVHGQGGNKTEAAAFAALAAPTGWQVRGIDLPEHGDRTGGTWLYPLAGGAGAANGAGLSAAALAGNSAAGQQHRGLFFHAGFCRGND